MDYEDNDMLEVEVGKNIFWFDGPIGRFRYFIIQLLILIFMLFVLFFKEFIAILIRPLLPLFIIVVLCIVWINFVAHSKRLYDISGNLKTGIICSILLAVLNWILPLVSLIVLILLCIIPGRIIKNNY